MRVTPILLIAIGLWGLARPETLLDPNHLEYGRWIFVIIIALGGYALWRTVKSMRR